MCTHSGYLCSSVAICFFFNRQTSSVLSRRWQRQRRRRRRRRSHDFDVIARLHRRFKHGRGRVRNEGEYFSFGGPVEDTGLIRWDRQHDRETGGLWHSLADSMDLLARQVREDNNFSRITHCYVTLCRRIRKYASRFYLSHCCQTSRRKYSAISSVKALLQ